MEHSGVFGVFSAINGSKNGSKFGRGEPFAWPGDSDVFEASDVHWERRTGSWISNFGLEHKFKKMRRTRCAFFGGVRRWVA
jgi:hypothetical protein